MEVLGKFFALVILAIAIFIAVPYGVSNMHDETVQEKVKVLSIKFSDEVREQGKITPAMYDTFIQELDATGYLYDVEMIYTKNVITPSGQTVPDGSTYKVEQTEESFYTDDIVAGIYDGSSQGAIIDGAADGEVHFNANDYFSLTVKSKSKTLYDKMSELVKIRSANVPRIEVHAGGEIRDENW